MMRIALVTETYPPELNGVAMTIGHLVTGLRDKGHRVDVIRPSRPDEAEACADTLVAGHEFPGYQGTQFGFPAPRLLARLWRSRRPDLVHIVTEGPLGWSALWIARRLGIPVTSSFHTCFDQYCAHYGLSFFKPVMSAWLHALHRRTAVTFVPTRALATELARHDIPGLQVLGRGCDTELFNPQRRNPLLRAAWGVPDGGLACLHVGRLAPEKNLALVEKAFAAIQRNQPNARMIWVGDGPSRHALACKHREHYFAGPQTGIPLAEHYASADLFLFPSLTETYGNVVPEAMASGLAVVAYDRAAASELIHDGIDGCRVPEGQAQAFVEQAVKLAEDADYLAKIRSAAANRMTTQTWAKTVNDFENALKRIADHECVALSRKPPG